MTRFVLVLVALAACKHGGGDDYPIITGGDDVISNPHPDAAVPDDGAVPGDGLISGRLCVMTDLRMPSVCQDTGADGVTVMLGDEMTTTAANGGFSINVPTGSNLLWHASGTDFVSTVESFSAVQIVPMISASFQQDLFGMNGVVPSAGEGSAVIYVVRAGAPLSMVTAQAGGRAFADSNSKLAWNEGSATGAAGVLWFTDQPVGDVIFTLQADQGNPQMVKLPIEEGAITYAVVQL